ncbi:proline-rich protein 11-like [Ciona intestinalis]
MQDLQNVKLKRRSQQTDENKNILPLSKLKLTKSLKKTNIIRSPGGTPLVKRDENQSTGTGLTPAFTRALKKKFEAVHKTSPISIEESPKSWRC